MHGLTLDGIYLGTAAVKTNSNAGRKLIECIRSVPACRGFGVAVMKLKRPLQSFSNRKGIPVLEER